MADFNIISFSSTTQTMAAGEFGLLSPSGVLSTVAAAITAPDGADNIRIVNAGTILSEDIGIDIEGFGAEIRNSGLIAGGAEGLELIGPTLGFKNHAVYNSGIIQGFGFNGDGIFAEGLRILVNSGEISATQDDGVDINDDDFATVSTNRIYNSGLISSGGSHALIASSDIEIVDNSGTMVGSALFSTVELSSGDDILRNTGTIIGDVDLGTDNDTYRGFGDGVTTGSVFGRSGNDTLTGGGLGDHLIGGSESDYIVGHEGDDTLEGDDSTQSDTASDTLIGGAGDDSISGASGGDILSAGDGNDTVFAGDGADLVVGNAGDDSLVGEAGADTLSGGAGNDTVFGGTNDDTMTGGAGNDSLLGDSGNDLLVGNDGDDYAEGGQGADTVKGGAGEDELYGGTENDTVTGGANDDLLDGGSGLDVLDGGAGNDTMLGGLGNDLMRGRDGVDFLTGGQGLDILTGGTGADVFVYVALTDSTADAQRDVILDFEKGVDEINLFDVVPGPLTFRGTAGFTATPGVAELRLQETLAGSTIVRVDADGNGTTDMEINVAQVQGLTADDFVL